MIVYTVEIPQLNALQQTFAQAPALTIAEVTKAMNSSLIGYQGDIKQVAPVKTGRYRGSVTITPAKARGNVVEGSVGPTVDYAIPIEVGTGIYGPHKRPITPKRAKVLAFKVGGKTVFAKSVQGMPARYPVKRALESGQDRTESNFQHALDNVANAIAKGIGS